MLNQPNQYTDLIAKKTSKKYKSKNWQNKNKPVRNIQIKLANIKNQINYNTKFDLESGNAKYKQIKTQYPKYNAHYGLFTGTDPNVNTNWKYVNYYDNQIQKQIQKRVDNIK